MVSVGTIVWLSSELMFFAGLFGDLLHGPRRTNVGRVAAAAAPSSDIPYALVVHDHPGRVVVHLPVGVFAAERGDVFGLRRWYLITLVMGTIFVLGQANEYRTWSRRARRSRPAPTAPCST